MTPTSMTSQWEYLRDLAESTRTIDQLYAYEAHLRHLNLNQCLIPLPRDTT